MTNTADLLARVYDAIAAVRKNHDGIPEILVVLGGSGKSKSGQTHGHFAPGAWKELEGETRYHEMFLSGESLARKGKDTMGTIIHELAHAYCHANKIQDTSNRGRYHNLQFKEVAERFGLIIEQAKTIGWSTTTVPSGTAALYEREIAALDEAIVAYRDFAEVAASATVKKYMMQCPECQDPVPTGKRWFERNEYALYCKEHEAYFEFYEEET